MTAESKVDFLINGILAKIRAQLLRSGDRLPSIREQAALAGVSKNTAVEVYLRLVAQGILISKPGSGFFVSRRSAPPARSPELPQSGITGRAALLVEQLERRLPIRPGDGRPPPEWLEGSELRRHLSFLRFQEIDVYNSPWGYLPLRKRLCGAMVERGIGCKPQQVVMTHGANHAMDLILRRYVKSGDAVLVDNPGYYPLLAKLTLMNARIVGVQRNQDGPDLADLETKAAQSDARFFFTQSLAHNPTGGSITAGVAYGVLKIATAHNVTVVENDPCADILPYTAPRLAALDQLDRVIYIGTFTKTLAASIRVGYVAASSQRAQDLAELNVITGICTSAHDERLIFSLIEHGHYLKHLRRLRARLSKASASAIAGLEAAGATIHRPTGGGYYIWVNLPSAPPMEDLVADAASRGIFIAPSINFFVGDPIPAMRVNVTHASHPTFLSWIESIL